MSHASSSKVCKYGAFLSFRGPDTRKNFVSHLYNALEQRGIDAFKDDERLETGKSISNELLKAIEESRFSIVIFSKSYASSRWCLEELAHIIKCRNELDQIVIPIFYDVSPSDVSHPNSPFAESFSQHEEKHKDDLEKVQRWREACKQAGKISGYHLQECKDEADCITKVVDYILPNIILPVSESLVGTQIDKVISLLHMKSDDVCSVGIWGMGGIGKTKIASVIYERYRHQFEAYCFLGDVGEMCRRKGLNWLQKTLICKLFGKKMTVTSECDGTIIIKNGLRWKKVLLILDNVDHLSQLEFIVGGTERFGRGSRILITSRDKHLIITHVKEDKVYEVLLLSENEALELFCMHAFERKFPGKEFEELSSEAVKYANGLPLALKVLGSSVHGRDKEHCRDMIDRLKKIQHDDILGKLKIGLDGLDKDVMRIFLDIACLYNHEPRKYVERILESCGIHLIGINYLIEKSLLSVKWGRITMHNLISQMGQNVSRQEYAHNRIWLHEEVHDLFAGKLKPKKVESLRIPKGYRFADDHVNHSEVLKRMLSLQVLIFDRGTICSESTVTYLPSGLRWIEWPNYPSSSLPKEYDPSHLIGLCLEHSLLVELWPIPKKLINLKHLNLRFSLGLTETPNFGDMPNLEILNLEGCKNLKEVHLSIGHCRVLTRLDLTSCEKLKKLPDLKLSNLKQLNLRWCCGLTEIPNFGDMSNLETLILEWCTNLEEVHPSLGHCRMLTELNLSHCGKLKKLPELKLSNLKQLNLNGCRGLTETPNFGDMPNLETLNLEWCTNLEEVHPSLGHCRMLTQLDLSVCEKHKKLPELKLSNLKHLKLSGCDGLTETPNFGDMPNLEILNLDRCNNLKEVHPSIGHCRMLRELDLTFCEKLKKLPDLKLSNLKQLNLRWCCGLTEIPNFGDMSNLETLILEWCTNLEEVHPSLGHCRMLTVLNLSHCGKLKKLPELKLSNLKQLNLSMCGGLTETPNFGDMPNLETLNLCWCENLEEVHPSLGHCRMLTKLDLSYCEKLKKLPDLKLSNLKQLNLSWCVGLTESPNLGDMPNLETLNLYGCKNLEEVHPSLGHCTMLRELDLSECEKLKKLPELKLRNLKQLDLIGCGGLTESRNLGDKGTSLEEFPEIYGDMRRLTRLTIKSTGIRELPSFIGNLSGLIKLDLKGCEDLVSLPDNLCNSNNLKHLDLHGCKKLEKLPENIGELQELETLDARETAISQPPPSITKLGKLSNLNILGGLPDDLGSLQSLKSLDVRGSNISCLPKSIKELLGLKNLNVQFCQNLNELPEELPPNLKNLCADYHLVLKSIRDLVIKCLKLRFLSISWCGHEKSEYGTVSSEQVNVFLQHLIRTCIQCDFQQRDYFLISFPKVRIPELFDYQFINQKKVSIDLNPSWYTDKFMGFSICCCSNGEDVRLVAATLVCKSDPGREHSLKYNLLKSWPESAMCFIYIPFETLWHASDNKEGKNQNDYCLFEVYSMHKQGSYWGIRLEYENNDTAVTTEIWYSMELEQPEQSLTFGHLQASVEHNIATDRGGLHSGSENKDVEVDQAAMAVQKDHESQNVELTRVCDSPSRKLDDASGKRKRKRKRKRTRNKKRKIAGTDE